MTKEQRIAHDKARELTAKCNQIVKTMKVNKAGGMKFTFEYLRWVKSLMIERDRLWSLSA